MTDPTLAALKAALTAWMAWARDNEKPLNACIQMSAVHGFPYQGRPWTEVMQQSESVLRVLDAQAGETGWQPIETAPKDGSDILGFRHRVGYDYWACLHWESFQDGSAGWIGGTFKSAPVGAWSAFLEPTHWMPLPEPPR